MDADNIKKKIAVVFGSLPYVEEIDQFLGLDDKYQISIITSQSIAIYLKENSFYNNLSIISLPDYDENSTYLPGLEQALASFAVVIIKDRLGLYAYQALKAKWRFRFRLVVWIDNLVPFVGQDVTRMRTIRNEVTSSADGFIVQSDAAYNSLLMEGINEERIYRISPSVNYLFDMNLNNNSTCMRQAKKTIGLYENDLVLGYFGEIEWEEGLFDLLHGVSFLIKNKPSYGRQLKLVVFGIGSFAGEFKQRSVELKIDQNIVYLIPNRQSKKLLLQCVDCLYVSPLQTRDRLDGNPFRYITAMVHKIPVISSRSQIVEETVEKHRIDFCTSSPVSLASAIEKALLQKGLTNNIVAKNTQKAAQKFRKEQTITDFAKIFDLLSRVTPESIANGIDSMVCEVEDKVNAKQYLAAIDLIEDIFSQQNVPNHHRANLLRLVGDCFIKLGDKESGKNAYIQAIELDPYSAKAHIGLGTTSLMKQHFELGVIHFQKAVSLSPKDEMANLGLGLAFQGLDELKEASKWVVKSLEINPENSAALYSLVRISQDRGEFEDALKALQRYLQLHPNDYNIKYTLAGILFRIEKFEEVVALLTEITTYNPMDSRAQSLIRQARKKLEKSAADQVNG